MRLFTRPVSTISTTSTSFVGDTLAAHKVRLNVQPRQHFVDHRTTAMHHNGVHPDLSHQNDVAGKGGHCLIVAHGVAAKFHDNHSAGIALKIGQGF
jgi:hypothetical protein